VGVTLAIAWTLAFGAPEGERGAFSWDAPSGCPDAQEMTARIEAAGGTGDLIVQGVVRRAEDGAWEATLAIDLHGERDARVLRGESCEAVAKAAELLVAVRRDAIAEPVVPEPEPEPEPGPEPQPQPEADASSEPEPAPIVPAEPSTSPTTVRARRPSPRLPTGVMLGAAAGVGLGATPAPDVPVEIAIGGSWPRFRVAVRGRWYVPRRVGLSGDRSARVQVGTAGVEACARPAISRLEVPLCGQVSVGGSRADGGGVLIRDRAGVWAEIGLDVGLAWHLRPWWALTARLGGAAVLAGTRYIRGDEVVFDPAPIHGRLVLGVDFHVPIRSRRPPEKEGSR
jgi:hypothetical protein